MSTLAYLGDSGIVLGDTDAEGIDWRWSGDDLWVPSPAPREQVGDRVGAHGTWDATEFYGPRVHAYHGVACGEHEALHRAKQRLQAAVSVRPFRLRGIEPGFDRQAMVRRGGDVLWTETDPNNADWSIALYQPDPFIYATEADLVASTGLPSQVGGLVWATTMTPEVVQLVTNPSAGLPPSGWGGTAAVTQDSTRAHSGTKSFLINGGTSAFKTWFVAPPNTTYTLSGWVWIPSGETGNIRMRAGSTGFVTNNDSPIITARDQWVRASVTATTDADGGNVALYPGVNLTGPMWADDLMITLGSTLYDYFDGDQPGCAWDGTPHASTSRLLSVISGGATWPATWDAAVASGALSVENVGSDPAYPLYRVFGPLPDFSLSLPTGESLAVDLGADGGQLAEGEWIEVDMLRQKVMLLGQSSRRRAVRGSFFGLPPGKSSVMFGSSVQNQTAFVEIEGRSTWL